MLLTDDLVKASTDLDLIGAMLPQRLRDPLLLLCDADKADLQEIRLRLGRPVILGFGTRESFLSEGGTSMLASKAIIFNPAMRDQTMNLLTEGSVYAFEDQIRGGYVTVAGGHRVGLVGRAVTRSGRVETIRDISGINIRFSRDVITAARELIPSLLGGDYGVYRTLIVSPPGCGKTTILRDLARRLSSGIGTPQPFKVCIVDERSEIAGCWNGMPQRDVGMRTDVLDRVPKAEGIMMVIRSMSPEVIITDELGRDEDFAAIAECVNAGVSVIATAHAGNVGEVLSRPTFKASALRGHFDRYVELSRYPKIGTVRSISSADSLVACSGVRVAPSLRRG